MFSGVRLAVLGTAAMLASCADEKQEPLLELGLSEAPLTVTDQSGATWERIGKIAVTHRPKPDVREVEDDSRRPLDVASLTDDELAEVFAPLMRSRGYEYELSKADRIALARQIRADQAAAAVDENADAIAQPKVEKTIINGESRVNRNSDSTISPWRMIALMDDPTGVCSGFKVVNQFTMATAAHCVYDTKANSWYPAANIQFAAGSGNIGEGGSGSPEPLIPGVLAGVPDGSECFQTILGPGYKAAADQSAGREYDYAIIVLRGTAANCPLGSFDVGWFSLYPREFTTANDYAGLSAAGYPGAPPYGLSWPTLTSDTGNGEHTSTNTFRYWIDVTGGQSGGPVHRGTSAWGLNITEGSSYNRGIRFNNSIISWYNTNKGF